MNRNLSKSLWVLAAFVMFSSCENDDQEAVVPVEEKEFKFVRVLVNDEVSNELSLITPTTSGVESFQAQYPKSALYGTQGGRFGAIVSTANNFVQLFDTGLEAHGDHVDVKGTAKFGALTGSSNKPTHFKSKGDEIITFNDGDGTLSIAREADFHTQGAVMSTINTGNTAHHGAMAKFDNGSYAITEKDGTVAGSLPERVKVIDATGKVLFASALATKGIHGNAGNGQLAVFGSVSGVLVVEPTGKQHLVSYPEKFGTSWLSSILEAKAANKFIGYAAAIGAYIIDPVANTLTPVVESADLIQVKIDFSGQNLIALFHSGEVRIYNITSNTVVNSGTVIPATAKDETQKPQIEATSRYLYITQPKTGEVFQVSTKDFAKVNRIKVSGTPYRLTLLGLESSEGH